MYSPSEIWNPKRRLPAFLNQPRSGRVAYAKPNWRAMAFSAGLAESSST